MRLCSVQAVLDETALKLGFECCLLTHALSTGLGGLCPKQVLNSLFNSSHMRLCSAHMLW
jgi:hypothetical protein